MSEHVENCRRADRLIESATGMLQRAVAFSLHAAADAPDAKTQEEHLKGARDLRQMVGRLPNIRFEEQGS